MCIIRVFLKKRTKKFGEMAERSKAAVLKTVDVKASWGSNPYLSAIMYPTEHPSLVGIFYFNFDKTTFQKSINVFENVLISFIVISSCLFLKYIPLISPNILLFLKYFEFMFFS